MGIDALLARMERRAADTPDTPCNYCEVSAKPLPLQACTLDTPDTSKDGAPRNSAQVAGTGKAGAAPFTPTIRQVSAPLIAEAETAIRAWLALIGETDPATIAAVLHQCAQDADARNYFTLRAAVGFQEDRHRCEGFAAQAP